MKNPMMNSQLPAHFVIQSAVFCPVVSLCFLEGWVVLEIVAKMSLVNFSTSFSFSSKLVLTIFFDNFCISLEVLLSSLFVIVANSYGGLYRFS